MAQLPVTAMVLYKHGVGYFVRSGEVSGSTLDLTFRKDEVNDVLKSLTVFDRAEGGQVLGVHYQTPMDKVTRLASSSIKLSPNHSLTDLLKDLRGRHVVMTLDGDGSERVLTGRVVGITRPYQTTDTIHVNTNVDQVTVTLLAADGAVRVFSLDDVRSFTIEDEQAAYDLRYFLDTATSEADRRVVNVSLSDGTHDLFVSYVAPSPTWRVSYRLVAEADKDSDAGTGTALLQGWGLFDNRLDEDLENVQVTLVAGQPISFIYDLYASRIPQRKTIQDEARVTGPVEFDDALYLLDADAFAGEDIEMRFEDRAPGVSAAAMAAPPSGASAGPSFRRMSRQAVGGFAKPQATGKATGETFQYEVSAPVSVKRGESALVPIIGAEVQYTRELLYNSAKLPDHPVAALRFVNNTGLTLERGPVTVVEDSDYKGEAIISFTREDGEVYLAYAVELGVRVEENETSHTEHHALDFDGGLLLHQQYYVRERHYKLENNTNAPKVVTLEVAIPDHQELFDMPAPDAETLTEKRWRVRVAARSRMSFTVQTREIIHQRHSLRDLTFQQVQQWAEKRFLDQDSYDALADILKTHDFIRKTRARVTDLFSEREKLYEQQEENRKNLAALSADGPEANLRGRVLAQLEQKQTRLEEIDRELNAAERTILESEANLTRAIEALAGV